MNNILKKISLACTLALGIMMLASCGTSKDVIYFQDLNQDRQVTKVAEEQPIKVQPKDKLSIIVNSRDPQLTDMFNLPYTSRQIGQTLRTGNTASGTSQGLSGYTVDSEGNIDFPVIGKIHVADMTREQIAAHIKSELMAQNMVKDPVVTVEFMNLTISVLGEVNSPGRYSIDRDQLTLIDAIGLAGDLTIYGNRHNVKVLRQEGQSQLVYDVDLTSATQTCTSPAYYLQQNDVIYVEPNNVRARQSTVNGNNVRSTSFWISLASLLTSVAILVFN